MAEKKKHKNLVDTRNDAWQRNKHRLGLYALMVLATVVLAVVSMAYIYAHAGSIWLPVPVESPEQIETLKDKYFLEDEQSGERIYLWDEKGDPVPMPKESADRNPSRKLYYGGVKKEDDITYMRVDAFEKGSAELHIVIDEADISGGWYLRMVPFFGKVIILQETGYFEGCGILTIALVIFFASLALVTGYVSIQLQRRALYSYRLVVNGGICIFSVCQFIITVFMAIQDARMTETFTFFYDVVNGIRFSTLIIGPIMLVGALIVAVSNIQLIRHEGFRSKNLLGIFIAVVWIGALVLFGYLEGDFAGSWEELNRLLAIQTGLSVVMNYAFFLLVATVLCGYFAQKHLPLYDKDYIIILGCRIRKDGTPTPILQGRVDRALAFEKEQFQKTGKHAVFVPSGGQGEDEPTSEAESMRQYLLSQGVPDDRILPEGESVNTFQNIRNSKKLILTEMPKARVAFSTTNYHVFRSYVLSKDNDIYAEGMSAKTKKYFFPNAFLREFFGLLYAELIPITLVLVGILVTYLSFVSFLK